MPLKQDELLTPEQIKAFDDKYGEEGWARIAKRNYRDPSLLDFELAIRQPTDPEYQQFKSRATEANTRGRAQELLVKAILIHPTPEKMTELKKRWPAIYETSAVSAAVQEMLGMVSDQLEKE